MLRKFTAGLLALLLAAGPTFAAETVPLFYGFDLDVPTETADDDQVVASVNLTNTSFTIAASPDVPREVAVVVVDTSASITAGTVTVTGTNYNDEDIVWAIDISGGAGTYNSIDTSEDGDPTYLFKTVTDVTADSVATLDGGGDETIKVGTTDNAVAPIFCNYSPWRNNGKEISSPAADDLDLDGTAADDAFAALGVGDRLRFRETGSNAQTTVYITTWTDADNIIVNKAVTLTTAANFSYSTQECGYGDSEGWVKAAGVIGTFHFLVEQMGATNDIARLIQCRNDEDPVGYHRTILDESDFSAADYGENFYQIPVGTSCDLYRVGLIFATTSNGSSLIHGYDTDAGTDDSSDSTPEILHGYFEFQ